MAKVPSRVPFQWIKCNKVLNRVLFQQIKDDIMPSMVLALWAINSNVLSRVIFQ